MSKRKSSKRSQTAIVFAVLIALFGAALFATLFLPLYKTELALFGSSTYSISQLISEEINNDTLSAAVWTGFAAAIAGALVFVLAIVSMLIRAKAVDVFSMILGVLAVVLAIVCLVLTLIFNGDANSVISGIKPNSLQIAPIVAMISAVAVAVCAKLKN